VTWSSSNEAVATVDISGVVTAVSNGTATITVTTQDGGFTANCVITVNQQETRSIITVSPATATIISGDKLKLTASIANMSASNQNIRWASSNDQIASVDTNGMVTALTEGEVKIKATSPEGYSAECAVIAVKKTENTELVTEQSILIYPNPFSEYFELNYSGKEVGRGTIILYNSDMRPIAKYPFEKSSLNFSKRITINGLINGVYYIQFNLNGTKIVKRLFRM
jgi:uncharacterized protein YjdB